MHPRRPRARRPRDYTPEQYLKSPQEMAALFADLPELIENTVELAKRCNLELSFGTYFLPAFPVPETHTLDSFIRSQSHDGLVKRLSAHEPAPGFKREDYTSRLDTELAVIVQMGFEGYFLIVADFINWAKHNDIPVGPGRGSGAGSLVAYALGITDLDPLRYGLLFERFLNPERVSMPDFDVDFCMDGRDRVIEYVGLKYGRERVSQIITYGTMAAKAVLRDTGRVLGMPYGQVDRIAKLIPKMPLDLDLEDALGRSEKSRAEPDRVVTEFKMLYETDDEVRELVDLALKLEDLTRNAGKHAGGVVIAPGPLSDFSPLFSENGAEGMVTQFDKDDVEKVGLVKFDFLGLRTLTIIDWTVKAINTRRAQKGESALDIMALPLDDAAVFDLFKKARTVAVFQFESRGMQGMLKDAKPDRTGPKPSTIPIRASNPSCARPTASWSTRNRSCRWPRSLAATRWVAPIYCVARWARRMPRRWPSTVRSSAMAPPRTTSTRSRPMRSSTRWRSSPATASTSRTRPRMR